jgi:hypothetical protein
MNLKPKLFLRVETIDGEGAYRSDLAGIAGIRNYESNMGSQQHPCPYEDAGIAPIWRKLDDHSAYIFGFETISHYLNWFLIRSGRDDMNEAGGYLSVYAAPDIAMFEGQFQAIAHKESLTLIERLPTNLSRQEYEDKLSELLKCL